MSRLRHLLALVVWALPIAARAHGADANQIQLVVHEAAGELVATPAADLPVLRFADDDGNGRLSRPELDAHRAQVRDALVAGLEVTDAAGRPATVERADVSLPQGAGPGAEFVRLTTKLAFAEPPGAVTIRCTLLGEHPVLLLAHRAEGKSRPGTLVLLDAGEQTWFDAEHPTRTVLVTTPVAENAPAADRRWVGWMAVALAGAGILAAMVLRRARRR